MWSDNDKTSASEDLLKLPRGPGAGPGAATPTPALAAPVLARLYARFRERKQEATT